MNQAITLVNKILYFKKLRALDSLSAEIRGS